jgi:hypothetical protein
VEPEPDDVPLEALPPELPMLPGLESESPASSPQGSLLALFGDTPLHAVATATAASMTARTRTPTRGTIACLPTNQWYSRPDFPQSQKPGVVATGLTRCVRDG